MYVETRIIEGYFESYKRNKKKSVFSIAAKCINSQLNVRFVPIADIEQRRMWSYQ